MMKQTILTAAAIVLTAAAASPLPAQQATETRTETTKTTTTTVVTEKVATTEKTNWRPFKVCVLDFNTIDTTGQKRFLSEDNKPIVIPPQCTLTDEDRKSIDAVMQGYVRMIDAWDNTRTNDADRAAQIEDNAVNRKKALDLYDSVMNGPSRPMVIGAEYLSAYLGRHNDVFGCMDVSQVAAAMEKIRKEKDFPKDFMLRIAKETGATHLIYGTLSDLRTKSNSFSGYGIETKTTTYQLDVIVKMIDLAAQCSVYSNVYTGSYREQRPISGEQFDDNIFQSLMTSAMEEAAEDIYNVCKPGSKNKVSVTPMPYGITVSVTASGKPAFKASDAEVYADGLKAAAGGETVFLPAGRHKIEVRADGFKTQTFDLNVTGDRTVSVKLEQ